MTAAEGYVFADSVTAQVGGNDAILSDKSGSSITVSYTYAKTNAQGQTAAPSFTNASYPMLTKNATTATFTLTNSANTNSYKLYTAETDGNEVQSGTTIGVTGNEQSGKLCGVYVDGNDKVTWMENSSFDANTNTLLMSTTHFSVFGVGYKETTSKFTDTAKHWAKNDIDFVAARGLLSGTGKTTFSPNTSMTRGMFVTALGRLAGVDTKKHQNIKFTDVKADAYYSPYVAWANVNNIVNGITATTFSPDQSITRQEMAVMLVNYSKAIGYKLPSVHAQVTFTDSASIGAWAKSAVYDIQQVMTAFGLGSTR